MKSPPKRRRRIDYSSITVIRQRAAMYAARREKRRDKAWLVAGFRLVDGQVRLAAIAAKPGGDALETCTLDIRGACYWATKQAAWQWLQRRPVLASRLRIMRLPWMDVLDPIAGEISI